MGLVLQPSPRPSVQATVSAALARAGSIGGGPLRAPGVNAEQVEDDTPDTMLSL
jgi:hypothetical protein